MVLAAVYASVAALGDTRAWSGSDAGGKAATVKRMVADRSGRPDLGYWAESSDPDGSNHPIIYTERRGGGWVQVTSLPYVYASVPLYRALGPAGLLVIPALGGLVAALAALLIARRLGAASGWGSFWLMGLTSPAAFYAVDAWEHAVALGLFLAAVAAALSRSRSLLSGMVAGLALGLAVVSRTEVLLYALTMGVAVSWVEPAVRRPLRVAVTASTGLAVLAANHLWESRVLGAGLRASRAGESVSQSGSDLLGRLSDGSITSVGLFASDRLGPILMGLIASAALVGVGWAAARRGTFTSLTRLAAALVAALVGVRALDGLGFIPGFLPSTPSAGVGLAARQRGLPRAVSLAAVATLPLVWLLQWRGQLVPQWGGRYVLITGALLLVCGAVAMEGQGWRQPAPLAVVGLSVVVGVFGLAWHIDRTNGVARGIAAIEAVPADTVIVSDLAHLGREGGAFYGDHRWLRAAYGTDMIEAAEVLRAEQVRSVEVVGVLRVMPPRVPGYRLVGERHTDFLGIPLGLWRYTRSP